MKGQLATQRPGGAGGWLDRTQCITWQWFTFSMSTGGLAILLYSIVHRFDGLDTIGTIVFIANLVIFVALVVGVCLRFATHRGALTRSLTDPSELFFMPTVLLAVSTIITGAANYGMTKTGPWLGSTLQVIFWIHLGVCLLQSWTTYLTIFGGGHKLKIADYTPGWILPFLPLMLLGTVAASIVPLLTPGDALNVAVGGLILQGLGFILSLLEFALYLFRLSIYGLPPPAARPTMFIAVGPPAFTSYALLRLSENASSYVTDQTLTPPVPNLAPMIELVATLFALLIWGLALWFFVLALACNVAAAVRRRRLKFGIAWWSFVFPNVGWALSTNEIGKVLGSNAITWVAAVMTIMLVAVWLLLLFRFAYAVLSGAMFRIPLDDQREEERADEPRRLWHQDGQGHGVASNGLDGQTLHGAERA
ncbi:uncharacterized protein PFL1_00596 [Pseudozyma flocculosa PF-1]|uniref:Related to C4-dicarboxylate transport protein mae1 n=1 Tax=Pseudozyma flocculosa TaxID=84751 RepID=A0A5C3ESE4_9BASI|nr:uncharacterized protein PFL1_00596 [Pseudozyma flocculosa PF-1]EPQ32400.1 hypothetical protein PFL1_00596 [Pseudozyma flocculosa PF-1]SPO34625.1 related to C4-dicarboxylate transport protein mae1 [Pseudozyma flocculosa]